MIRVITRELYNAYRYPDRHGACAQSELNKVNKRSSEMKRGGRRIRTVPYREEKAYFASNSVCSAGILAENRHFMGVKSSTVQ